MGHSTPRSSAPAPVEVVGAAIVDDLVAPTRLLAARRTEPAALAGGWELPGGKVDPGETCAEALHREIREELGVEVALGDRVDGPLERGRWPLGTAYAMTVHLATVTAGEPAPIEDHDALRWVTEDDLYAVAWLPADLPVVEAVAARFRPRAKP
ncbi:8-oxo-dGTP diphosphatase [Knoellia remsis]|uniref:8-oxo-dGTP diphosphatase n=1 Tax=Knoellia remsis TaxID=407159 RepID=A0A2T0UQQ8_9MICO|nr:(deoxy)nucleoside triphosphate pyrophosphohydrolase [Knoellia remsis]PRY60269.1 8-oxo-dGTP diphosphatase [Knoellia remsis]